MYVCCFISGLRSSPRILITITVASLAVYSVKISVLITKSRIFELINTVWCPLYYETALTKLSEIKGQIQ